MHAIITNIHIGDSGKKIPGTRTSQFEDFVPPGIAPAPRPGFTRRRTTYVRDQQLFTRAAEGPASPRQVLHEVPQGGAVVGVPQLLPTGADVVEEGWAQAGMGQGGGDRNPATSAPGLTAARMVPFPHPCVSLAIFVNSGEFGATWSGGWGRWTRGFARQVGKTLTMGGLLAAFRPSGFCWRGIFNFACKNYKKRYLLWFWGNRGQNEEFFIMEKIPRKKEQKITQKKTHLPSFDYGIVHDQKSGIMSRNLQRHKRYSLKTKLENFLKKVIFIGRQVHRSGGEFKEGKQASTKSSGRCPAGKRSWHAGLGCSPIATPVASRRRGSVSPSSSSAEPGSSARQAAARWEGGRALAPDGP